MATLVEGLYRVHFNFDLSFTPSFSDRVKTQLLILFKLLILPKLQLGISVSSPNRGNRFNGLRDCVNAWIL